MPENTLNYPNHMCQSEFYNFGSSKNYGRGKFWTPCILIGNESEEKCPIITTADLFQIFVERPVTNLAFNSNRKNTVSLTFLLLSISEIYFINSTKLHCLYPFCFWIYFLNNGFSIVLANFLSNKCSVVKYDHFCI